MIKYFLLCALLVSEFTHALIVPKPSPYDRRIQTVDYNEFDVVEINTTNGYSTQILFADGEDVIDDRAASGFVDGWTLTPKGNTLFIKAVAVDGEDAEGKKVKHEPIPGEWNTNINVTTNRRVYQFDLKLHSSSPKAAYFIKFKYPQDEAKRLLAEQAKKEREVSMDKTPVVKNSNYKMQPRKRSDEIIPTNVFDDGTFTYFTFAGNRAIPAIFHVNENKEESIVNFHIDPKMPGTVVIHQVGRQFYLRYGKAVVGVYNEAFDSVGEIDMSGTTVDGVKREIKGL